MEGRKEVSGWLRAQAMWCSELGSPLYEDLLTRAAADVLAGGPVWSALKGHEDDPPDSALALRFMGGVHRLVLEGRAPDLAAHYPSAGGREGIEGAWAPFVATVETLRDDLRTLVERGVQTNEVGRSGALVGGFLQIARETGAELRILETGASAGLNLRWDHYLYEARGQSWGVPASPVRLCDYNSEQPLPFDSVATVVERRGCDLAPLDPAIEEDRTTLLAYVWPDQLTRIRLLRAALEVAQSVPAPVDRATAPEWLERHLIEGSDDVTTVVFHSIFFQYLSPGDQARFVAAIEAAGAGATNARPLAWLRMEPGGDQAEVRMTSWPGGRERLLASSGFHGAAVRWLG